MSRKFLNIFYLFCITTLFSCNNDDDAVGGQQILQNDTSASSGQLTVRVVDNNNVAVTGVRVTLYATYEDLQNDIWLYDRFNDNRGEVNFGFINIGNYYVYAEENGGARRNNDPGDAAQVRSQQREVLVVVVR